MRTILLAPGDIINATIPELKTRRVDVRVDKWIEEKDADSKENKDTGTHPKDKTLQPSDEVDTHSDDIPKQQDVKKSENTADHAKSKSAEEKADDVSKRQEGHPAKSETQAARKEGADLSAQTTDKQAILSYVLTPAISATIEEHRGHVLGVLNSVQQMSGGAKCYHLSAAVGRSLGLSQDNIREQTDKTNALRKSREAASVPALMKSIEKIESIARFDELFPDRRAQPEQIGTSVVYVTNSKVDIPRAHVMYTAPTGDTNWKEVAREATKRRDLRAYVYDPTKKMGTPQEAFISLIDSM
nr:NS4 [Wongorr virus]